MKIRLKVDVERFTLDDLVAIEEGKMVAMRNVLARAIVDKQGNYLPKEEAEKVAGALTIGELREVVKEFGQSLKDAAVPPLTEGV